MENLKSRLEQLKGQEAQILMQLDEVRVLMNAYSNTIEEKEKEDKQTPSTKEDAS
tara:strand:- start:295 stop:459 length:165 start_codon:yes stop_codon:yes gene_type:complete